MKDQLDFRYFFPEIYQAIPGKDYTVYAYVNDGSVRKFDAKPFLEKGGIFECLKNEHTFRKTLTVIGNTVAWDLEGNRDPYKCIDINPLDVFDSPIVPDIDDDIS